MAKNTSPSLMKDICKGCNERYYKSERYKATVCPVCVILVANQGGYIPGTDAYFMSKEDHWYVVKIPHPHGGWRLTMYNGDQYRRYLARVPEAEPSLFSGPVKACTEFIKQQSR